MKLEDIDLDTIEIDNIREQYDDLDMLGDSLLKGQQEPIIVGPLVNGKRQVRNGCRRVMAGRLKGIKSLMGVVSDRNLTRLSWPSFSLSATCTSYT